MSNKNAFLLPQGSPYNSLSHYHPSTSFVGLTGDEILFHDHGHAMLSGHYLAAAAAADAPVIDAAAFFNQDGGLNEDPSAAAMVNSCPRAAKKDRHSKIYTAQGPRDRRVRLSIGVARRFFDLQEILGFDKPSKTLDWLLTKSKTAIKDLVQTKDQNAIKSVISSPSECEVDSAEPFDENGKVFADSKRKLVVMNDKGAARDSKQALNLVKESRVKARARARERTREKMCIKQLNDQTRNINGGGCDLNPSIPIQYMNNQLEFCKISGSSSSNNSSYTGIREAMLQRHPSYEAAANEDLIEESIVIKRKVKHPSSILGFHQNLIISSSNYGVPSPYNATDNWDFSSFTSQSNICAILDQHKFINSTSNN